MEPTDLTVRILQEIRDELRGHRASSDTRFGLIREELGIQREELRAQREESAQRFEAIESALRDMAEQLRLTQGRTR
ncbi:MAG: hypothetical protein HYV07_13015 [Deltaproteobacteria bacterium]|nr:hypothetical protein [Deltaproteobacteria bacterium]